MSDPTRLLDDPSVGAALRGDLAHGVAAQVQGLNQTAGLAGLQAAIAAETAATTGAVTAVGAGGSLLKIALLLLGIGTAGAAAWGVSQYMTQGEPDRVDAPERSSGARADHVGAAVVPAPPPAAPVGVPPAPRFDAAPDEEPSAAPLPVAKPRAVSKPAPTAVVPPTAEDYLREAKMVAQARRALGTGAAQALALTKEIAAEFPSGQLVEEREAIAIRALAKLGRDEQAQSRARTFLRKYGSGPHAEAVRRATQ